MKKRDLSRFAYLMQALTRIYEGELDEASIEIYFSILGRFTIEEVDAGVKRLLAKRVFPSLPMPGDVADHIVKAIHGDPEQKWLELLAFVRTWDGHARHPDALVHAAVLSMGGYQSLSEQMTIYNQDRFQRSFRDTYMVFLDNPKTAAVFLSPPKTDRRLKALLEGKLKEMPELKNQPKSKRRQCSI